MGRTVMKSVHHLLKPDPVLGVVVPRCRTGMPLLQSVVAGVGGSSSAAGLVVVVLGYLDVDMDA